VPDRIEREIEELLNQLDEPGEEQTSPIPIGSKRQAQRPSQPPKRGKPDRGPLIPMPSGLDPATLMFAGAGVMLAGLLLSTFAEWFILVSFAGVVMFIAAFLISFARGWPRAPRSRRQSTQGAYWRDRYIKYDESDEGTWARIKRMFRR